MYEQGFSQRAQSPTVYNAPGTARDPKYRVAAQSAALGVQRSERRGKLPGDESLIGHWSAWLRGALKLGRIEYPRVERLVFVCKGNICRSAYAAAYAEQRGHRAVSCGLEARAGLPADPDAARAATRRGVLLDDHLTSRWLETPLQSGDLVLAMEPWHLDRIGAGPSAAGAQIGLLGRWAEKPRWTIPDPYGDSEEAFARCFALIESSVQGIEARLAE
jgi:protein-tyrosine phosphatase